MKESGKCFLVFDSDCTVTNGYKFCLLFTVLNYRMIESVGDKVTNLNKGDMVMPLYLGECGECLNCSSGKTNLCHKYPIGFTGLLQDGTSRMSINGERIYHHFSCSTWSEYVVIEACYAYKVDPRMSLPHSSFLCCGFTTGFGAAFREITLEKGSAVAVIGLGAVGLGVIQLRTFY